MSEFTEAVKAMPKMISGKELATAMTVLPEYDDKIRDASETARLVALADIYNLYVPSTMSHEIYTKLYLSLLRSLQKKHTIMATRQRYENNRAIRQQAYNGILGGSDSYTIIGSSGIGKSSAISRAVSLITSDGIIETRTPYSKIIPCLTVQCPFDSSVKGMLLEILRKADEELGTSYYERAIKSRTATTDMLIGVVSTVALNHIGLLIVDEIQNVANSKNGKSLVGMLTQLINNSGISICMVGTPESAVFFEQAMQLARRSLGLRYDRLEYDQFFYDFCDTLFRYQYTRKRTEMTEQIAEWLYEHSAGVVSVVVSLVHDAQEIAILDGTEELNIALLNKAYQKRLSLLHEYIEPCITRRAQCGTAKKQKATKITSPNPSQIQRNLGNSSPVSNLGSVSQIQDVDAELGMDLGKNLGEDLGNDWEIGELVMLAKERDADIVLLLREKIPVVEVAV